MFSFKSKLDPNLKSCLSQGLFTNYRVIIKCKRFDEVILKKIPTFKGSVINSIPYLNIISAFMSPLAIERLLEFPEVTYIALDPILILSGVSVSQANGVRSSESIKLTGKGIGVGLVDSGVFPHQDLLIPSNRIKFFRDLLNGYQHPYDDNGHGTFISGIICGSGFSSQNLYKGISTKASLCVIKAFNSIGRGYASDVLNAISQLIDVSEENNIKVLCLPFEILEHNKFITSLFDNLFYLATSKNITPILPSGNNPNEKCTIKGFATSLNCITVGGINTFRNSKEFKYSSSGPFKKITKPDFVSSCVNICSLNSDTLFEPERNGAKLYPSKLQDPYTSYTGTSCAAAYISAVCALLYEYNNNLSFKDVLSLFRLSCETKEIPKHSQGEGFFNLNLLLSNLQKTN